MKKLIIVGFLCGLVGFVAGNAFWYLASPLWIDREVSEALAVGDQTLITQAGQFVDADAVHKGKGQVSIIQDGPQTTIRFTDFEVTNGPDLYVWLVKNAGATDSGAVKASEVLELGLLKGNIGDQNYVLPSDANIEDWSSVVIWCRQFGVLFASAELTL